jgi:LmbE family N-acetylglucosaminyl deacetylase
MTPEKLMDIRIREQRAAADVLGVKTINYLDKEDGYITADLQTRREIITVIRKLKPQIIVSCDPANLYTRDGYINHPDHRSVGQQVLDAVFPGAGNSFFFPELLTEDLAPHKVKELWLSIPNEANTIIDVTVTWPIKLLALAKHVSQVGDAERLTERMNKRSNLTSIKGKTTYEERFKRIVFK